MTDRTSVDIEALLKGGVDIAQLSEAFRNLEASLRATHESAMDAAGHGPMREQFDASYLPTAQAGLEFLELLNKTLGEAGGRTLRMARNFGQANDEATTLSSEEPSGG